MKKLWLLIPIIIVVIGIILFNRPSLSNEEAVLSVKVNNDLILNQDQIIQQFAHINKVDYIKARDNLFSEDMYDQMINYTFRLIQREITSDDDIQSLLTVFVVYEDSLAIGVLAASLSPLDSQEEQFFKGSITAHLINDEHLQVNIKGNFIQESESTLINTNRNKEDNLVTTSFDMSDVGQSIGSISFEETINL